MSEANCHADVVATIHCMCHVAVPTLISNDRWAHWHGDIFKTSEKKKNHRTTNTHDVCKLAHTELATADSMEQLGTQETPEK